MVFLICGGAAFALFIVYDINGAGMNLSLIKPFFCRGMRPDAGSDSGDNRPVAALRLRADADFEIAAVAIAALLIYTLFFALPFRSAYVDGRPALCTTGMYALCRHPGILWLGFAYASLFFALPCALTAAGAALFTALDVAYAVFQDMYTFPRIFKGYGEYRRLGAVSDTKSGQREKSFPQRMIRLNFFK